MKTSIASDNWCVVDHMVGGVGGDVLLDRDLGNMVSNLVDHRGGGNSNRSSMDNWGSMGNSKRGMGNSKRSSMSNSKRSSMGNGYWGNSGSRSINTSNQTMSKKTMSNQTMSNQTMSKKTTSNDLGISISSGGSKTTGNKGRKNNKRLHIDCAESIPTIPMYSALI